MGLGTDRLSNNEGFQRASYGFTVFSIIAPVITLVAYVGIVVVSAVWNVILMGMRKRRDLNSQELGAVGYIGGLRRSKSNKKRALPSNSHPDH